MIEAVSQLSVNGTQIESARQLRQHIQDHHHVDIAERFIITVLKENLRMKYSRIRDQALHVNAPVNIHKRQTWAQIFLRKDI